MWRCYISAANWGWLYVTLSVALSVGNLFAGLALVRNLV